MFAELAVAIYFSGFTFLKVISGYFQEPQEVSSGSCFPHEVATVLSFLFFSLACFTAYPTFGRGLSATPSQGNSRVQGTGKYSLGTPFSEC